MRIALSGPPSVGKTTQGRALARWLGVPHISSGELIRSQAAAGNPAARRLLAIVADGSLAPSQGIADLVLERLASADCCNGFVLDGFPRKPLEADLLLSRFGPLDLFAVLTAPADVLVDRLRERSRQSSFIRDDDDPAVFPRRIAAYESETSRVRSVMVANDVPTADLDATGSPESIQMRLRDAAVQPAPVREADQPAFVF